MHFVMFIKLTRQFHLQAVPHTTFPFAEFIIAFGFLSILTAEQIVIDCNEKTTDCRTPIERLQARNVQLEKETLTVVNQVIQTFPRLKNWSN